jgi:hypothetical protein
VIAQAFDLQLSAFGPVISFQLSTVQRCLNYHRGAADNREQAAKVEQPC